MLPPFFRLISSPFSPGTTISFALPAKFPVDIRIYNLKGQLVRTLCSETYKRGFHKVGWDGKNQQGREAASGLYIMRLEANKKVSVCKAMLLK